MCLTFEDVAVAVTQDKWGQLDAAQKALPGGEAGSLWASGLWVSFLLYFKSILKICFIYFVYMCWYTRVVCGGQKATCSNSVLFFYPVNPSNKLCLSGLVASNFMNRAIWPSPIPLFKSRSLLLQLRMPSVVA